MPSKKEKHQQVLNNAKTTALANSTNTTPSSNPTVALSNSYHSVTTNHYTTTTTTKKKSILNSDPTTSIDHLSLIRDQKHELDQLNGRFSNYVAALRKKSKENEDLQKLVNEEKQKHKNLSQQHDTQFETQVDELRNEMDESAVLTEHFNLKRNRALKEIALWKEKIRTEEDPRYKNRLRELENEYQQRVLELKELTDRFKELETSSQESKNEMNQMNDLYKKLEDELHDLILNNFRLECNLRTIEEKTLLKKAIYETEKNEIGNDQIKQRLFYTNELDRAINDIKRDFQTLLQNNKVILENAYTERIEQVKTQISTYQANKQESAPSPSRVSVETLHDELRQAERARDDIDNEYGPLLNLYMSKQKEKSQFDEERIRLDNEYNRLLNEITQLTEAIEVGKQYWFSVHFELETYKRLLDLQTIKTTTITNHHSTISNGTKEDGLIDEQRTIVANKKVESQRAISKTGKFDMDQVQVGFISINNAATNCVDQPLKGWTLVRSVNEGQENVYHFPDNCVLKARTRVRIYSNKVDNGANSTLSSTRLIATSIPAWASTGQGENVKILLLDEKGINRAQYTETWQ